jgi:hypothetical protein
MVIHRKTEITIGVLYALGAGFQAFGTLQSSRAFYREMVAQAWLPPAESLVDTFLVPNSFAITVLVALFEASVAIAILSRKAVVRPALVAGGVFSVVGALTGGPVETIGYAALAALHFKLAADRQTPQAVS